MESGARARLMMRKGELVDLCCGVLAVFVEKLVMLKDADFQFVSESCFKAAGGEGVDGDERVGGGVNDGKGGQ